MSHTSTLRHRSKPNLSLTSQTFPTSLPSSQPYEAQLTWLFIISCRKSLVTFGSLCPLSSHLFISELYVQFIHFSLISWLLLQFKPTSFSAWLYINFLSRLPNLDVTPLPQRLIFISSPFPVCSVVCHLNNVTKSTIVTFSPKPF